jgi:hypothetical protein
MINTILMIFLMSNTASAGSICNDGTYSYSEGRGTCSHHGGVSSSGVYLREKSTDYSNTTQSIDIQKVNGGWFSDYGASEGTASSHHIYYIEDSNVFGYTCYILNNSRIGELVTFEGHLTTT